MEKATLDMEPQVGRNGHRHRAPGLQQPLSGQRKLSYYDIPMPIDSQAPGYSEVGGLLDGLLEKLSAVPLHGWHITWEFVTKVRAAMALWTMTWDEAASALEERAGQAKARIAQAEAAREKVAAELSDAHHDHTKAKKEFGDAMSKAGLVCEDDEPGPWTVQDALDDAAPDLQEVAGAKGQPPVTSEGGRFSIDFAQIRRVIMENFAPAVSGFVLSLTLGTLIGLISLTDLQRSDRLPKVAFAAALGCVTVALLGLLVSAAVESVRRIMDEGADSSNRFRRIMAMLVVVALAVAIISLACAEMTAEGMGLRELHLQRMRDIRRIDPTIEIKLLPLAVYMLMGFLISGPYLAFEAATTWNEWDVRRRKAENLHDRRKWIEEKRKSPDTQRAFAAAHEIIRLNDEIADLEGRIEALDKERDGIEIPTDHDAETKQRLDDHYVALLGAIGDLHAKVSAIVEEMEPLDRAMARLGGR